MIQQFPSASGTRMGGAAHAIVRGALLAACSAHQSETRECDPGPFLSMRLTVTSDGVVGIQREISESSGCKNNNQSEQQRMASREINSGRLTPLTKVVGTLMSGRGQEHGETRLHGDWF